MTVLRAKQNSILTFGKYKIKFAILENSQYVFSERDISLFIGGRGGKNFKCLSASNIQKYISPKLKEKLINRIQYCNQNSNTVIHGYDAATVIDICKVRLSGPHNAAYNRAKTFYDSLSMIGLTALVNEVLRSPLPVIHKISLPVKTIPETFKNIPITLNKSEIIYRIREILN